MTEEEDYPIAFIFTLDDEGVHLNMNFICPQCNQPLSAHDVEVFLGDPPPERLTFTCPKADDEAS